MPLGLESRCNIRPMYPASINKAVFFVPCCVLPEDPICGLVMQGKLVARSRGATTYHQNIEHISSSHDYLQHDFSRDLKNEINYSQMINMLNTRGVLNSIMDLNI